MQTIIKRVRSKTPSFFKKVRNIGLSLAAAAGVMLAKPKELPEAVVKIAGYLAVAGCIMSAVSQTAVKNDE